jgi:hypothetical protein
MKDDRTAKTGDQAQGGGQTPAPDDGRKWVPVFTGASLDLVKIVAAVAMTAAHANEVVLHNGWRPLWDFGRLSFPLFSFAVACNLLRGAREPAYLQMFLLVGALSQPFYPLSSMRFSQAEPRRSSRPGFPRRRGWTAASPQCCFPPRSSWRWTAGGPISSGC